MQYNSKCCKTVMSSLSGDSSIQGHIFPNGDLLTPFRFGALKKTRKSMKTFFLSVFNLLSNQSRHPPLSPYLVKLGSAVQRLY